MSLCVCIASNKAVILILFYSYGDIQVSTLEIGVKVYLILPNKIKVFILFDFRYIFLCKANGVDGFSDEVYLDVISFTVFPFIIIPLV